MLLIRVLFLAGFFLRFQTAPLQWSSETLVDQAADDRDPRWSPDGSQVAFVGHEAGNPEVYVQDIASGEVRNISNDPEDDYAPVWSPDGAHLAYFHRDSNYGGPVSVWVADVTTGETHLAAEVGFLHDMAWHGDTLLVSQHGRVWRYDTETQLRTLLYEYPVDRYTSTHKFSPDGRWLVLEVFLSETSRDTKILLIDTVTGDTFETDLQTSTNVVWSPDSRFLALTNNYPSIDVVLRLFDAETKTVREIDRVIDGWIGMMSWSPDNRLSWTSWSNETRMTSVRVLADMDGASCTIFEIGHSVQRLIWSPTRNHLAFQTYSGVYVADVASGVFSELIQEPGRVNEIEWSADGAYIAATYSSMYIVEVDDSSQRFHEPIGFSGSILWSPVDARLVFTNYSTPYNASIGMLTLTPENEID